jgi:hypothetical protein
MAPTLPVALHVWVRAQGARKGDNNGGRVFALSCYHGPSTRDASRGGRT